MERELIDKETVRRIINSPRNKQQMLAILESLPSAQPETHEERTEMHACDLISRQAAIDAEDDK